MALARIRVGDEVIAIAGKNKGQHGKVLRILVSGRIVVEGLNMVKKHVRPDPQRNQQGGVLEKEAAIHASNLALLNPATSKADRVGTKVLEDGSRVRCFKSNDEVVDI